MLKPTELVLVPSGISFIMGRRMAFAFHRIFRIMSSDWYQWETWTITDLKTTKCVPSVESVRHFGTFLTPPKMATAENPTSGKAAFDHVAGHGSLQFLACEQVLDSANLGYSNLWSLRVRTVWRGTRIFRREAGDLIERGGWLRVQRRVTHTSLSLHEMVLRCHTKSNAVENGKSRVAQRTTNGWRLGGGRLGGPSFFWVVRQSVGTMKSIKND